MAITYLKRGKADADRRQDDAQARTAVETTLADIEARGDAAIRDLSQKFDGYTPDSFRLSQDEIDARADDPRGFMAWLREQTLALKD